MSYPDLLVQSQRQCGCPITGVVEGVNSALSANKSTLWYSWIPKFINCPALLPLCIQASLFLVYKKLGVTYNRMTYPLTLHCALQISQYVELPKKADQRIECRFKNPSLKLLSFLGFTIKKLFLFFALSTKICPIKQWENVSLLSYSGKQTCLN